MHDKERAELLIKEMNQFFVDDNRRLTVKVVSIHRHKNKWEKYIND
jgi:isochorismate hydrolase